MKIPRSMLKSGDNEKKDKKIMGKMSRKQLKSFKKQEKDEGENE